VVGPLPLKDLGRAREILSVLIRHGFGGALRAIPKRLLPSDASPAEDQDDRPTSDPERALRAIEELGPTFIKLGQILSTRPDILPQDYLDAFARLQDAVPPFPTATARDIVAEELETPVEELFAEFGEEPVASASIAQVHRAKLADGRVVAVKIQRPDIEDRIRSDINILYRLAEAAAGSLEDIGMYSPAAIIGEFERAISVELDFQQEAHNAEVLRRNLTDLEGVRVPEVYRRYSTRRVLTEEWLDAVKVSEVAEGQMDAKVFMDRVIASTYQQIFVDGFFHADPHPGNLLVGPEGQLCYVDFGLMGQLTRKQQSLLVDLFVAILFKDAEAVARACYRSGGADERLDLRAFAKEADSLFARYGELSMREQQEQMGTIFTDLVQLSTRHRLQLPQEYAMLARAGVTLDGLARQIAPDWNMFETLRPLAIQLATRQSDPSRLGGDVLSLGVQAVSAARDLPLQLDQILMDLEGGRFRVETHNNQIEDLTRSIRRLGITLQLSIGAGTLLVSAAVLTAATDVNLLGFPFMKVISALAIVISLGMASGLLGALGIHMFMTGRLRSRLLQRFFAWLLGRSR
jgi:ubiquinone biosynthesis protein